MRAKRFLSKITNNAYIFSVIAKVISIITGIIYSILFARYLGSELRGQASIILNYSEMFSLILCLGIYQAYPYFKKRDNKDIYMEYINYVFGLFFLYILIGLIIVLVGNFNTNFIVAILLAPLLMAIKQLNYVVLIENPKLRNLANIKLDLFDIIFLIVLLLVTKANYALCIALLVIKQLVFFVIAVENLKINIFKIRPSLKGIRPYIKYGLIPMITVILMEINYKVDVIMLERFNIAVSEIGVYSIGVMLAQKLWLVPDALKDILLSKLAKGKTSSEVAKISRISFFIMLIMITAMVAFGKTIISLMYGAEYNGAYGVTLIILAGALGMVFYKMIYSYNVVNGHKNVNLFILGISALFNVLVNALMIPKVGIIGAAIASLISYSLCGIAFLIYFCKTTKTNFLDMILIKKEDMNLVLSLIKK